jgi:hypothetical protein
MSVTLTTGFAGQEKGIIVYGPNQTAIKTFQKRLATQIFVSIRVVQTEMKALRNRSRGCSVFAEKQRYAQSLIADSNSVVKPVCAVAISDMFLSCANFFTDSVCVAMSMCVRSLRCRFEK